MPLWGELSGSSQDSYKLESDSNKSVEDRLDSAKSYVFNVLEFPRISNWSNQIGHRRFWIAKRPFRIPKWPFRIQPDCKTAVSYSKTTVSDSEKALMPPAQFRANRKDYRIDRIKSGRCGGYVERCGGFVEQCSLISESFGQLILESVGSIEHIKHFRYRSYRSKAALNTQFIRHSNWITDFVSLN